MKLPTNLSITRLTFANQICPTNAYSCEQREGLADVEILACDSGYSLNHSNCVPNSFPRTCQIDLEYYGLGFNPIM